MEGLKNYAAWLDGEKKPLRVGEAPITKPGNGEILVKVGAVAINPAGLSEADINIFLADYKMQDNGNRFAKIWPIILGFDIAGTVVALGEGVTKFKVGDRIMGAPSSGKGGLGSRSDNMAFQHYTVLLALVCSRIPDSLPFTHAAVLPISLLTAAAGLYRKEWLALPYPKPTPKDPTTAAMAATQRPSGGGGGGGGNSHRALLVWGGASSVGSSAIQLAAASGLSVVATASPRNFAYVRALGAAHVFDYRREGVADELVALLRTMEFAGGYDAIGDGTSVPLAAEVVGRLGGGMLATSLTPPGEGIPDGVHIKRVYIPPLADEEAEVGSAVCTDYVPYALENGSLQTKPDPEIYEGGLESIQKAIDLLKKGVSAKKIVVKF